MKADIRSGKETKMYIKTRKVKERRTNLFQSVGNGLSPSPFKAKFVQSDSRLQKGTRCYIRIGTTKRFSQENFKGKGFYCMEYFNNMLGIYSVFYLHFH